MTHATTSSNTRTSSARSRDILLNPVIILLPPLFLSGTDGDLGLARAAAYGTVAAYRAHNHASLLVAVRVIAFSLAALDSLGLSMRDDLSIPLILRLRANANALNRSAERAEAILAEPPVAGPATEPREPIDEAAILASVAEAQARAAAARASLQAQETPPDSAPQPAPQPALQPA